MYQVKVLRPGYAIWTGPGTQKANGTITLVKGKYNIIVDTGNPVDRDIILESLRTEGLSSSDIHFVICTHGHSDHVSNNNLFPDATFIVSYDISRGDLYTFHNYKTQGPYRIDSDIEIVDTPGHTKHDVTVIVKADMGIVAITGDLFESERDLADEQLWRQFSEYPEDQERNRKRILELADLIVPGHGQMFAVPKSQSALGAVSSSQFKFEIVSFLNRNDGLIQALARKFQTQYSRPESDKIRGWLAQFGNPRWMRLALRLLENIDYIDDGRITDLFAYFLATGLSPDERKRAVFTVLGGAQDSSSHIIFLCSKAVQEQNRVGKFDNLRDIIPNRRPTEAMIVFVDDNIGSGKQSVQIFKEWLGLAPSRDYVEPLARDEVNWLRKAKIMYFALIAFEEGVRYLQESLRECGLDITVQAGIWTKKADSCFLPSSLIFDTSQDRVEAMNMAFEIGYELFADKKHWPDQLRKERALGYGNSQKVILFSYNTPTCTLPIFWKSGMYRGETWVPIFPRRP